MATELPLPRHYDPSNSANPRYAVRDIVRLQVEADEWQRQYGLSQFGSDRLRVHLLVMDNQYDFSFPTGTLYVGGASGTGAIDDQRRLVEFIYRNLGTISRITCTMDSHLPYQVFFPSAHLRSDGTHPEPYTIVSAEQYRRGEYRPNPAMAAQLGVDPDWLRRQFVYYCEQLGKTGRYQLTLWPYHCMIGSNGQQLAGVVDEARLFHSFARGAANVPELKGSNPLTEHYSIFRPEVMTTWDGRSIPGARKNAELISTLLESDVVIIAGEAKSHCVAWSVDDLLQDIRTRDASLAKKVYLLEDCTSPIVVPGVVDYTEEANAAFQRFANAGMHVVRSTTPISEWPGVHL